MIKKLLLIFTLCLSCGGSLVLADTNKLTAAAGWQKLTALPASPTDYYYVFVESTNSTDIAMRAHLDEHPYFHTFTEANYTNGFLWGLQAGTQTGTYAIYNTMAYASKWLSVGYGGGCWDTMLSGTTLSTYTDFALTFSNGTCTIQNISTFDTDTGGRYLGLWSPGNGYKDGEKMAGNKSSDDAAKFYVYAIEKSKMDMDVTSRFVKDATFESMTYWTCTGSIEAVSNGSMTGSFLQKYAEASTSGFLGSTYNSASKNFGGAKEVKQTITLPKGAYLFKAEVVSRHLMSDLYVTVGSNEKVSVDCTDLEKNDKFIAFEVTEASSNVIIGYETAGSGSSTYVEGSKNNKGNDLWFAIDNAKLYFMADKSGAKSWTALLTNPNFDNGKDGWTCGSETWIQESDGLGTNGKFLQRWDGSIEGMHSQDNYQTVTLPNGVYRLSARIASEGCKSYLYANVADEDEYVYIADGINPSDHDVVFEVKAESRSVQLGYRTTGEPSSDYQSGWAAWHAIDNVTLEYLIDELDFSEVIAAYNTYNTKASQLDEAGKAAFVAATAGIKARIDASTLTVDDMLNGIASIKAAYRVAILAQTTDEVDMTDGLVNPKFDEGKTGWTCSEGVNVVTSSGEFSVPFLERYGNGEWWASYFNSESVAQQVTLHEGVYSLSADISSENLKSRLYVKINGAESYLEIENEVRQKKTFEFNVPSANTVVELGYKCYDYKDGFNNDAAVWFAIDNVSLTFKGNSYDMQYQAQQNSYASLMTQNLSLLESTHLVYAALQALVEQTVSVTSQADYDAKVAALEAAYQRAVKYNQARADLNAAQAAAATTNIAYMGELNNLEEYYAAGTFEDNNVNLPLDLGSQTWGMIPTLLLTDWNYVDNGYYINTWSTEGDIDGSNFTTPFFEYWVERGTLAAKIITATVTGKTPGAWYGVTADVRVRTAAGNVPTGITLTVGGVGETDVCTGAAVATPNMYLGTFTAYGQADAEGKVTISFKVKDGTNVNWLSFKNVNIAAAISETITYALGAEYGTLILPFAAEVPSGMTAYTCEAENNGTLTLVEASSIEANTPYIISGTAYSYEFKGVAINKHSSYTSGWLTGVLESTPAPVSSYVMQNNHGVLGFYLVVSDKQPTVGANHAYLKVPGEVTITSGGSVRQIFSLNGNATGIESIENGEQADSKCYDLSGRRIIGTPQRGIYIINGKKLVK